MLPTPRSFDKYYTVQGTYNTHSARILYHKFPAPCRCYFYTHF
nr:MAG TPA: hypothetical protein [Caudoviricetes sp.]